MIYIMRLGVLWLMIFNPILAIQSQTLEKTIEIADTQFALKNYQLAVKEYQRALFFAGGEHLDYLYQQIGHSFFINNQIEQALYFYELSYKTATIDSIKYERIFDKSVCYIKSGDYKHSIFELTNLPDSLNEYFNARKKFYFAVSFFGLEDFAKSESYFIDLIPSNKIEQRKELIELFENKKHLYRPNPNTAKILSMILPGTGQMYACDVKSSINSLLLTGSFVMLAVVLSQEYSILDALWTSVPWFMRYYKGGYFSAKKIAQQKRAIRRDKTYKNILEIVTDSKGIK